MSNKKIKILLLTWEMLPIYAGGLGVLARSVVEELRKQGAEVVVALPHIPKFIKIDDCISLEKAIQKYYKQKPTIPNLDFHLEFFKKSNRPAGPNWPKLFQQDTALKKTSYNLYPNNTPAITRSFAFAVLDCLKKNPDFDIVIGMDWETIPTMKLMKETGLKTPFAFYINGTEYDRNLDNNKLDNATKTIWGLEKKYYNQADFLICVSDLTKNILISKFDVEPEKITTVFNDVDFKPGKKGLQFISKNKTILFIGRISAQKGLFFLIDTMAKVVKIDSEIKLIIAGDGELVSTVMEKVCELELENNIIFTGWLSETEKKKIYKNASLFLMPSPSEPFGLTPLESISSGLAVISSENCGFLGVIPSTPTFKYYDTEDFSRIILYYLNNREKLQELIQKQSLELSKHSWSKEIGKILTAIKKLKNNL